MSDRTCRWPDCDRPQHAKGFCPRDYQRAKRENDYEAPWLTWARVFQPPPHCRWPECDTVKIEGRGLCKRHWYRAHRLDDFEAPWTHWVPNVCQGCGEVFTGRNRRQKHCSDACALAAWKVLNPDRLRELGRRHTARRRAQILGTTVEKFTEADVRARSGDACYLCRTLIDFTIPWPDPRSPSLDHIVPLSKGGSHTLDNVAMTCLRCNQVKNANPAPAR